MVSERDVPAAIGAPAYGSDGERVGTVEGFYDDDRTGATTWVALSSGLLGRHRVIAPADDAALVDGRLELGVPSGSVSHAPELGGEHLTPEDEQVLRRHYGTTNGTTNGTDGTNGTAGGTTGSAVGDRADQPAGVIRSEERLRVGTTRAPARRVRVVKYVVTEEVQVTVPVRREEIRIEELPDDTGPGGTGQGLPDELVTEGESLGGSRPAASAGLPDEIVLHAERPVVTVEVVPVERVRLRTDVVQGEESVTASVQREQVVLDPRD